MNRTRTNETIKKIDETVTLMGWVHASRRMGKITFFDVRDRWGIVQVVVPPSGGIPPDGGTDESSMSEIAKQLRSEFVVRVTGLIKKRNERNINPDLPTGSIELDAQSIEVISESETPPFEIDNENVRVNDETRLEYRYLDLRHERMRKNIELRHRTMHFIRNYLTDQSFIEVQTPILTKSTPEGARDFLVPSRLHQGKFFALPQSPQQYKQLLMVAGMERYFQIAPCFRDEDARADRSPGEFYQLDMEMSFVSQEDILAMAEALFIALVEHLNSAAKKEAHKDFVPWEMTKTPFPRLTHKEAMEKYGSDKPDMRKDKDNPKELSFAWVLDFPLFTEQTASDHFHGAGDTWAPSHHMFTAPMEEDIALLDTDPGKVRAYQHDLVLNGHELGGGSVRIHDPAIQEKVFDLIGFSAEQKEQFGHLLRAFRYGVPPHGGIAPGIDRLIMLLAGEENIREVTAFPLTGDARDPLMGAPAEVAKRQLDELGIQRK